MQSKRWNSRQRYVVAGGLETHATNPPEKTPPKEIGLIVLLASGMKDRLAEANRASCYARIHARVTAGANEAK